MLEPSTDSSPRLAKKRCSECLRAFGTSLDSRWRSVVASALSSLSPSSAKLTARRKPSTDVMLAVSDAPKDSGGWKDDPTDKYLP